MTFTKHEGWTAQQELDYWAMLMTAAQEGAVPGHDCKTSPDSVCNFCVDFYEAKEEVLKLKQNETQNDSHNYE